MRKLEIIIEDNTTKETIYIREIYNDGLYPYTRNHPDEEFCKALNLPIYTDNLPILKVEVNMKNFFIEWWGFLQRIKSLQTQTENINKVCKIEDPNELYKQIYLLTVEEINKYFIILSEIQQYTESTDFEVLDDRYTMYLKIF